MRLVRASPGTASLGPGPLQIEADFAITLKTPRGEILVGQVLGNGEQLSVHIDRLDGSGAGFDRRAVGRIADLLASWGITALVIGPQGPVATMGADAASRVGQLITGSPRVAIACRRESLSVARVLVSPGIRGALPAIIITVVWVMIAIALTRDGRDAAAARP